MDDEEGGSTKEDDEDLFAGVERNTEILKSVGTHGMWLVNVTSAAHSSTKCTQHTDMLLVAIQLKSILLSPP